MVVDDRAPKTAPLGIRVKNASKRVRLGVKNTIAVIFDFDDTLTPDSTSQLLLKHKDTCKITPQQFWRENVGALVRQGWDSGCAYLHLLLQYMKDGRLPPYTNAQFQEFGSTLNPYPGLKGLFTDLRSIASEEAFDITFFIVSGGIQDIVEGFRLRPEFRDVFDGVWGCQLAPNEPDGPVQVLKRVITFTEKTRYLFEINKGITSAESATNSLAVNKHVPQAKRPIPFSNMIYIGDGISDIPCFSLIQKQEKFEGTGLGIFHPGEESARRAWLELIGPQRVKNALPPQYGKKQGLGSLLRTIVRTTCSEIKLRGRKALAEEDENEDNQ